MAEVERASPAIVEEQSVRAADTSARDREGDRLVDRVGAAIEAVCVGVPVDVARAASIEWSRLVAEPVVLLAHGHRLAQRECVPIEADRLRRIRVDPAALAVADRERQSFGVDRDVQRSGLEAVDERLDPNTSAPELRRAPPSLHPPENSPRAMRTRRIESVRAVTRIVAEPLLISAPFLSGTAGVGGGSGAGCDSAGPASVARAAARSSAVRVIGWIRP